MDAMVSVVLLQIKPYASDGLIVFKSSNASIAIRDTVPIGMRFHTKRSSVVQNTISIGVICFYFRFIITVNSI